MIKFLKISITFFLLSCLPVMSFCENIVTGESKPLGNGTITSWIKIGDDGKPQSIGITITEDALKGLPGPNDAGAMKFSIILNDTLIKLNKEVAR